MADTDDGGRMADTDDGGRVADTDEGVESQTQMRW